MNEFNRVLAYKKALEISNDELQNIAAGSVKLTVHTTQRITGYYPGPTDVVTDQEWD
jgi:hypothetical protein